MLMLMYFGAKTAWNRNWARVVGPAMIQERRRRQLAAEGLPTFLRRLERIKLLFWEAQVFYEATNEIPVPQNNYEEPPPPPPSPFPLVHRSLSRSASAPPVMSSRVSRRPSFLESIPE